MSLYTCDACGALISGQYVYTHAQFHTKLNGVSPGFFKFRGEISDYGNDRSG